LVRGPTDYDSVCKRSAFDGEYSGSCGSSYSPSSNLDGTNRGLAFFITERRKHYQQLNEGVFRKLASAALDVLPQQSGGYEIVGDSKTNRPFDQFRHFLALPTNSYFWNDAVKHFQKDGLGFLLESINRIKQELTSYNEGVAIAERRIRSAVADRLAKSGLSEAKTYPDSGYYLDQVILNLVAAWSQILSRSQTVSLEAAVAQYDFGSLNGPVELAKPDYTEARAAGAPIGRGSKEQASDVLDIFNDLIKDVSFISEISRLKLYSDGFGVRLTMFIISDAVLSIFNEIIALRYKTKCSCCPTLFGMARDFFFG